MASRLLALPIINPITPLTSTNPPEPQRRSVSSLTPRHLNGMKNTPPEPNNAPPAVICAVVLAMTFACSFQQNSTAEAAPEQAPEGGAGQAPESLRTPEPQRSASSTLKDADEPRTEDALEGMRCESHPVCRRGDNEPSGRVEAMRCVRDGREGAGRCRVSCREAASCEASERRCVLAATVDGEAPTEAACLPGDTSSFPGAPPQTPCQRRLKEQEVVFRAWGVEAQSPPGHPELLCDVADPVWVSSEIHGVRWINGQGRAAPMLMACPLALALTETSRRLSQRSVTEVHHVGTTLCRTMRHAPRLSQHAFGLAVDVIGLRHRAKLVTISRHWEQGALKPRSPEGRLLKEVVKELHDAQVFNIILTPEYNEGHADHLHLDLTPGRHFLSKGPDQLLMGD